MLESRPSPMDGFDPEQLGSRLRALRELRGLSVRELGRRLGISASAVSQIERGLMTPSVNRLLAMVTAMEANLSDVFDASATPAHATPSEPAAASGYVLSRGAAAPVELDGGVLFRSLAPTSTRGVDFFESTYPPGVHAGGSHERITHSGYEVGTVTSGTLTIQFPDGTVELGPGDSITFPCELPHRIGNRHDEPAVATWLIVHEAGGSQT